MDNSSYEDMMRINFNRFPQMYDRIDYYYVEYHKILRTIIEFLMPEFHIDIHTYEWLSDYGVKEVRKTPEDIGIQIYSPTENILYLQLKQILESNGLVTFTEPHIPHLSHHQWGKSVHPSTLFKYHQSYF